MANQWIEHVKEYASKHGVSYRTALKDPQCKSAYQKVKGNSEQLHAKCTGNRESTQEA
jgi:hypothetical protein